MFIHHECSGPPRPWQPRRWCRAKYRRARSYLLWVRQGRPRDIPVVLRTGRLLAEPSGKGLIANWCFDCRYMDRAIFNTQDGPDHLWDRLSAMYPVERVPERTW
jgi:hypothetical protein